MKRLIVIMFYILVTLLVAGCSKDIQIDGSFEEPWHYDTSLPVPVLFGADTMISKSSINDKEGDRFGIFAFDKSATNLSNEDGLMMRNVSATYSARSITTDIPWYYPAEQDTQYKFCSYSPYCVDGYVQTDRQVYVNVPVTDVNDVLWARTQVEGGYNADYIRAAGKVPTFEYTHKTACISFMASKDIASMNAKIVFIEFLDVPTTAQLCIADLDTPENVGNFIGYSENTVSRAKNIDGGGDGILDVVLEPKPQMVCQPTFIVPCKTLKLRVKVEVMAAGTNKEKLVEFELDPARHGAVNGEQGFLAGYHYVFNLNIKSPLEEYLMIDSKEFD